jgi:PHD/YefM family antitoxin component YafN of YafNO toxin-antitoxin module
MAKQLAGKRPHTIPLVDPHHDAAIALKRIRGSRRPLLITQTGKAAAVMLSIEAYQHAEREMHILRSLARGEREIAARKGHDLDDVLEEADRLLADG